MKVTLNLPNGPLTLEVPDAGAGKGTIKGGHPLYYVAKQPRATENYLTQINSLLEDLPQGLDVFELCGGIGLVPAAVWDTIMPSSWTSVDIDPDCRKNYIAHGPHFVLGDMYEVRNFPKADLVICDFPNNTLPKMWREPKRAELFRKIATMKPRWWEVTDVGYYWIHLANHWPIYQEKFGVQVTRQNYANLFDCFMRDNYGYKVTKMTVGGGAQYFLMEAV